MKSKSIAVFCCINDLWQQTNQRQRIRSRGFAPSLSNSEVITMEIVAEFQSIDTDKGIWQYFRRHWLELFPQLPSRSTASSLSDASAIVRDWLTFFRQAANLWSYKEQLQRQLAVELGAVADQLHIRHAQDLGRNTKCGGKHHSASSAGWVT